MQRIFKRKTSDLRGLYRALISGTKLLGYKYKLISGDNGLHYGFHPDKKEIHVGKDQSLSSRIVTLAHEMGHALDISNNPPDTWELVEIIYNTEDYLKSRTHYEREKTAWRVAKEMLQVVNGYNAVKLCFDRERKRHLAGYYRQLKKYEQTNPNSHLF